MEKIVCAGDNCIDYYDSDKRVCFGGNPVNVSVYLRRLGAPAAYIGAVGTDDYGTLLCSALQEKGIDISRIKTLPGSTALSHVSLADGDRVFGDYDEGVMEQFALTEDDLDYISGFDLLVTGLWGRTEKYLPAIRARGVLTAFDAATRPEDPAAQAAIPFTDFLFFSEDDMDDEALCRKLRELYAQGPSLVVATRGSRGSIAFDGDTCYFCEPEPCRLVDTMGAGDSFIAGFLLARLQKKSVPDCMKAGAACAAETIGYFGAW